MDDPFLGPPWGVTSAVVDTVFWVAIQPSVEVILVTHEVRIEHGADGVEQRNIHEAGNVTEWLLAVPSIAVIAHLLDGVESWAIVVGSGASQRLSVRQSVDQPVVRVLADEETHAPSPFHRSWVWIARTRLPLRSPLVLRS